MKNEKRKNHDIAIIGLACRFPGAKNVQEFWENLRNGTDSIRPIPLERWNAKDYAGTEKSESLKTILGRGGFLEDIDLFDAKQFKIKEERAKYMDPQQRLALEVTKEAIYHAGYQEKELAGTKTGVFFAAGQGDYGRKKCFLSDDKKYLMEERFLIDERNGVLGNLPNMIASNICYAFNFQGPNMVVDTMCSSSAAAIHLACQSLLFRDSRCAVAGGIQLYESPYTFIQASKTGVLSKTGVTRPFSKDADGYALSEGIGVLILKRLKDALIDGDTVYAIIKGTAMNSDGKTMSSATPNMTAQSNVMVQAMQRAHIEADMVSYLEANGTAMELGDPLEVKAAERAFGKSSKKKGFCALGSVESNIGHALHAAAMARIIKTAMALYHKQIPPTLHCEETNPRINFEDSPFYINRHLQDWKPVKGRRIAGINAFGIGGTNFHLVLEEFRPREYKDYHVVHSSLPEPEFHRKRYWYTQEEKKSESDILSPEEEQILDVIYKALGKDKHQVRVSQRFETMDLDSVQILEATKKLENTFGTLPKTLFFEYQTIGELAGYFRNRGDLFEEQTVVPAKSKEEAIAIVGLSGHYPGSNDLQEFWENLKNGKDCIQELPENRPGFGHYWRKREKAKKNLIGIWGGFLNEIDQFDPLFFQISPKEAAGMDPQERLFLETAWECIEDAGYGKQALWGKQVGVFAGVMYDQYPIFGAEETAKGNEISMGKTTASVANRVSYSFHLTGPSLAVNTMCSSSFTAIHMACESIRNGECEAAIAGGVNLSLHESKYYVLEQGKFLSSDGRCRSFGAGGDGYVPGEGSGAVLLKPMHQAEKDGDMIYGVIRATAINHGGRTNGFTVPSPVMQGKLLKRLFEKAGVKPESISYVEAHGTGTSLGDPIEIEGLSKAFAGNDGKKKYCAIGSVKSNIGHLEAAAGIAALTKVLLQMKYKKLVPSLHSETLNPYIDFVHSPFYIQRKLEEWKTDGTNPKRAIINAFGAGGSNASILIEEYMQEDRNEEVMNLRKELILLSARSEESLFEYAKRISHFLLMEENKSVTLSQIAAVLLNEREVFSHRLAVIAESKEELVNQLISWMKQGDRKEGVFYGVAEENKNVLENISVWSKENLESIAKKYVLGAVLPKKEWDRKTQKVSLPLCPFEKRRCWFKTDSVKETRKEVLSQRENAFWAKREKEGKLSDKVLLKVVDREIALVTMCDQENRNMFSKEIIEGMQYQFHQIQKMDSIKVIVVTGYDHIFSMGGTKEQLMDIADQKMSFTNEPFIYRGFMETNLPVISAMQGHASGGGMLLGLYADISIMALEAVYSAPFMKLGFTPGMGATYILKEKLGGNIATEMMYTARMYTGEELEKHGASVLFYPQADVLKEALNLARQLCKKRKKALVTLKKELAGRRLAELPYYIEREADMHQDTFAGSEVKEKIRRYFTMEEGTMEPVKAEMEKVEEKSREHIYKEEISKEEIRQSVMNIVQKNLDLKEGEIKQNLTFKDMGTDSITSVEIARDVNKKFGTAFDAVTIYDYPTIEALTDYVYISTTKEKLQQTPSIKENGADEEYLLSLLKDMKENKRDVKEVAKYLEENI